VALVLSVFAFKGKYELCLTYECQIRFLELIKLPISILSLSVLLGVMVGRFHGSALRIASYQQSEKNNTFRNFYDHRRLFSEWILDTHEQQISKFKYTTIESTAMLYHALFKDNSPSFVTAEVKHNIVQEAYKNIIEELHRMVNGIALSSEAGQPLTLQPAMVQIKQAIDFSNNFSRKYGIEILAADNWPQTTCNQYEFEVVANEIGEIFKLAFEFSIQNRPLQLKPPENYIRLAKTDLIAGAVTSALQYCREDVN
jgi:hypothetical protein